MPDGRPERFRMNGGHPLAQGLVAAYLGELPRSTYVHDSSLRCNHGTCTGMSFPPTATSGPVWNSYLRRWVWALDGINDYIFLPSVVPSPPFTLTAWVKRTNHSAYMAILGSTWIDASHWGSDWGLDKVAPYGHYLAQNQTALIGSSTSGVADSTWLPLSLSYDGTNWKTYQKGVLDGSGSVTKTLTTTINTIGCSGGVGGALREYFNGSIADLFIHNRVLTPAEIALCADPVRSIDYDGLILPPRRRVFAATAAGPSFKAAWARRQQQFIGGAI